MRMAVQAELASLTRRRHPADVLPLQSLGLHALDGAMVDIADIRDKGSTLKLIK